MLHEQLHSLGSPFAQQTRSPSTDSKDVLDVCTVIRLMSAAANSGQPWILASFLKLLSVSWTLLPMPLLPAMMFLSKSTFKYVATLVAGQLGAAASGRWCLLGKQVLTVSYGTEQLQGCWTVEQLLGRGCCLQQAGCNLRRSSAAGVPWSLLEGPFSPAAAQHASQSPPLGACLEGTRSRASKMMCILPERWQTDRMHALQLQLFLVRGSAGQRWYAGSPSRAASPEVSSSTMSGPGSSVSAGSLGLADFMDPQVLKTAKIWRFQKLSKAELGGLVVHFTKALPSSGATKGQMIKTLMDHAASDLQ
ncbi:hypothetical protein ABBQ38_008074 [Trebouxia sp. C0009 RCD-2024]